MIAAGESMIEDIQGAVREVLQMLEGVVERTKYSCHLLELEASTGQLQRGTTPVILHRKEVTLRLMVVIEVTRINLTHLQYTILHLIILVHRLSRIINTITIHHRHQVMEDRVHR
jgi:hypothetical protein